MTKAQLLNELKDYPDSATIVVKDLTTDLRYNINYVGWKNSSEKIILNFNDDR